MQITTVVKGAWDVFATKITVFLPMLIGAIIIFVVGLLVARLLKYLTVKLLKLIRLDKAGEKTGLKDFLEKGNILKAPSEIIGTLVYWFCMILVLIATLDAMGLPIVSGLLNDVFYYIPNVVAAVIVIVLGILLGNLLSAVVRTAASNAGLTAAKGLAKTALYAVTFFAGAIALVQLGIGAEVVAASFEIAFGAAALALALAFGLGGKDVAAGYLQKWLGDTKASGKR
ncbi:hypothetical protein ACFL0M_10965 [Thermodesulfobacteriota bacterium]